MSNWDIYFLKLAKQIAENSKCFSRQIGAIITKDNRIVSTGYNGPPKGIRHCDQWHKVEGWPVNNTKPVCPRRIMGFESGQGLEHCPAAHAERNALISAAYMGISTKETTIYCYCKLPCKDCMIEIINSGVKKIVCLGGSDYDDLSRIILKDSNIELEQIYLDKNSVQIQKEEKG